MPAKSEIKQQVALETERRARLGVPAAGAGVLFLLSAIVVNAVIGSLPSVGVVQGLEPALRGEPQPAVSARAAEVKFLSHHAFGLIAGSVLELIAVVFLMLVLLMLFDSIRFRNPAVSSVAQVLVIVGGVGLAVLGVAVQVIRAIRTHEFAIGHDFSEQAVEHALTKGTVNVTVGYLGLVAPLLLAVGMIMVLLNATRTGLITRWLRGLGIAAAIVILPVFAGIFYLQLLPAAWLVAMGFMFMGKLPSGDPPAWAAGESIPWPSQAEMRAETLAEKDAAKGRGSGGKGGAPKTKSKTDEREQAAAGVSTQEAQTAPAPGATDSEGTASLPQAPEQPAPSQPSQGQTSSRRRRKRR